MLFAYYRTYLFRLAFVEPVSSVGRAQGLTSIDPRFWSQPDPRRVPHIQLKSEILGLYGAEVESRVSRIYK